MGKSCTYNNVEYSDGAVVCQSGTEYRCNDGEWDSLGTQCGTRVDENGVIEVIEDRKRLPCITFFAAGVLKVGIRNSCAQCKKAVVSWTPTVGVRRYPVQGYSEIIIDTPDQTGQLIGEDPC